MKYVKTCICGDTQIEITPDTAACIRVVTSSEWEELREEHWEFPQMPSFDKSMWENFCSVLNGLKDNWLIGGNGLKIWCKCLEALSGKKIYHLDKCHFTLDKKEEAEYVIRIKSNYSELRTMPQETDMFGDPLRDANGNVIPPERHLCKWEKKTVCTYPQDFLTLLQVLERRLEKKKPSKWDLAYNEKKKNLESIQRYFLLNKWAIDRFKNEMGKYTSSLEKIQKQKEYRQLCESRQRVLEVDGELFFEGFCGFDIEEKHAEIQNIKQKLSESVDRGEEEVDYEIKWLLAESDGRILSIEKDCESKYRYFCIRLNKPDSIDDPQEYDHILVSDAGVVLIETKHWKGHVEIRPDGKWVRDRENDGAEYGERSPVLQMRRHETLMKKILPDVPIYSLLCFSNPSVILNGQENFKDYPIVYVEQLREVLSELLLSEKACKDRRDYIVNEIEKHKVGRMRF